MKIAVFGNVYNHLIVKCVDFLFEFATKNNINLLIEKELYEYIHLNCTIPKKTNIITDSNFESDFALSIGGDGTFLKTAAYIGNKGIPILGINIGRLGFLSEVPANNMFQAIQSFINNELIVEEKLLMSVFCSNGTQLDYPFALNDVSILKQDSSSMISIHTTLNGEPVHTYQADGLVLATPTGSTAYSMSVGGPIMVPQAESFILSPVASHSLTVRPLIVPDTWIIDLEIKSRTNSFQLALDGRTVILGDTTKLTIKKADFSIKVLKLPNHTFFDNLKSKLMWGLDKRN